MVGFLRSLGVDYVFDVSVGRELALLRVRRTLNDAVDYACKSGTACSLQDHHARFAIHRCVFRAARCMLHDLQCILHTFVCMLHFVCQVAKFSVTLALCCNVCGIARRSRMNSSSVTRSKRCRCRCSPRRALGKPLQHTIGTICNTQQHRLHACAAASVRRRRVTASERMRTRARRWVCYAEKTLGEYIIPHMSDAKSPQQVRSQPYGRLVPPAAADCGSTGQQVGNARSLIVCSTSSPGWLAG